MAGHCGANQGSSEFTSLVPRQLITAAPYASYSTYSGVSARAKNVAAADIVGGISLQQLPGEIATSTAVASQGLALSNLTLFASNSIEARITAAVFSTNVVFVAQNGNDSLAARNDPTRRFLTISNALKSANSGDLIEIGAGRWDECLSIKSNVNYHLCEGASVNGVVVNVDTFRGGYAGKANIAPWTWVYGEGVIEATNVNGVQFNASANLAIDIRRLHVDSKVAAVWVSGYSSFWLKTKERVDGGIHSKYINDQSGEIFVDIPGILRGCTFDGFQWIYWRGDIANTPFVNGGRVDRGYNENIAIFLMNGAYLTGAGNIWAESDGIDARSNSWFDWHGSISSATDAAVFVDTGSEGIVHGNLDCKSATGYWQLAGSGAGILCGQNSGGYAPPKVTVYGNVRGLMPIVNENGNVRVYGDVAYNNFYKYVVPNYWKYTNEPAYATSAYIPSDIESRFGAAINVIGTGTNIIYGNVSGYSATNAIWIATNGMVKVYGEVFGDVRNVAGRFEAR